MKLVSKVLLLSLLLAVSQAEARNQYKQFSIADAMESEAFQSRLDDDVRFYFGDSSHPPVTTKYGEWPSQKKTNAFNKSDEFACQWALLSSLLSLKKRALAEGGNAVINIKTNNDHRKKPINDTFECEIGNVIASVAVLGTVVKL